MALRDLLMLSALLIMVPMIFIRPHTGIVLWAWTAMLVPNTFLYGIGQSVRFNLIFAAATILAWFISKEPKRIPLNSTNLLLFLFLVWVCVATIFGVAPLEARITELSKFIKIVVFTVVIGGLVNTRLRVHSLLIGLALGMGYHGASEGMKFILTGGAHHVFGPARSIIGDNNHFALAMIFLLPILFYLYYYSEKTVVRLGLLVSSGLVFASVIGTNSRGGLIALAAVGLYGILRSKHKFVTLTALAIGAGFVIYFAPEHWFNRMSTIQSADQDGSFIQRVIAWKISILLALDNPFFGGGITSITDPQTWRFYAARFNLLSFIPTPPPLETSRAAHSVYFQLLGDTGFVGLGIFLLILFRAWRSCAKLVKVTTGVPELEWINNLARAFRVSLLAYAVAGAALNMAYFEMYYVLITLVAIQERFVQEHLEGQPESARPTNRETPQTSRLPVGRRPVPARLKRRQL